MQVKVAMEIVEADNKRRKEKFEKAEYMKKKEALRKKALEILIHRCVYQMFEIHETR